MAAQGRKQNADRRAASHRSPNHTPLRKLGWSNSDLDSADSDEEMSEGDQIMVYDSRVMGPSPPTARRPSTPLKEPSKNLMRANRGGEPMKTWSPRLGSEADHDASNESSDEDEDSDSTIKPTSAREDSTLRDLPPMLTVFEQRAGSSTSLSAYKSSHEISNYLDLEESPTSDAIKERVEAMRARNAEKTYHDRIPAEDAPPHLQMMVLLYQWAAWALDISDQKRREDLITWVNGRFLDFMMSGGRVPGYNLKQLLEIAGVDPKELYGYGGEPLQQGSSTAKMSSSQLAASINGQRTNEEDTDFDAAGQDESGADVDRDDTAFPAAQNSKLSRGTMHNFVRGDGEEENEVRCETDNTNREGLPPNCNTASKNHQGQFPVAAPATVHEGSSTMSSGRKRGATPEVKGIDQVCDNAKFPPLRGVCLTALI